MKAIMKIYGPKSTFIRATLYNIVAVLIILVIGFVFISDKHGPSTSLGDACELLYVGLMMTLMFPFSILMTISINTTNTTMVFLSQQVIPKLMLMNPLAWGLAGYFIHRTILRRRNKDAEPAPPAGRGEAPRP